MSAGGEEFYGNPSFCTEDDSFSSSQQWRESGTTRQAFSRADSGYFTPDPTPNSPSKATAQPILNPSHNPSERSTGYESPCGQGTSLVFSNFDEEFCGSSEHFNYSNEWNDPERGIVELSSEEMAEDIFLEGQRNIEDYERSLRTGQEPLLGEDQCQLSPTLAALAPFLSEFLKDSETMNELFPGHVPNELSLESTITTDPSMNDPNSLQPTNAALPEHTFWNGQCDTDFDEHSTIDDELFEAGPRTQRSDLNNQNVQTVLGSYVGVSAARPSMLFTQAELGTGRAIHQTTQVTQRTIQGLQAYSQNHCQTRSDGIRSEIDFSIPNPSRIFYPEGGISHDVTPTPFLVNGSIVGYDSPIVSGSSAPVLGLPPAQLIPPPSKPFFPDSDDRPYIEQDLRTELFLCPVCPFVRKRRCEVGWHYRNEHLDPKPKVPRKKRPKRSRKTGKNWFCPVEECLIGFRKGYPLRGTCNQHIKRNHPELYHTVEAYQDDS